MTMFVGPPGLGYASFIGLGLAASILGVAWPSMRASFGLPLDAVGPLLLTFTVGYLASSFGCGRLLARIDLGAWLALGTGALAASLVTSSLAPAWAVLVGLSSLAGMGAGAIDAGLNVYAATRWSPRRLNWLHACYGVGAMLGPLLITGVLDRGLSWRWGYAFVGLTEAPLAIAFGLTRSGWDLSEETTAEAESSGAAPIQVTLRLPVTWVAVALFFVYTGIEVAVSQWAFSLLTEARRLPAGLAGLGVSAYWASLTAGRILFGLVRGRRWIDSLSRACLVAVALGSALVWVNAGPLVNLVGLAVAGVGLAPIFPWLIASTPERLGPAHAANAVGFEIGAAVVGGAVVPAGIGVLAARAGLEVLGPALLATTGFMLGLHLVWAPPMLSLRAVR